MENQIRWNRRRVVAAMAVIAPATTAWLHARLRRQPKYILSVFAHPASPLPEKVRVTVSGMCGQCRGDGSRLGLRRGARGHRCLARLCPHCVESGSIQIKFSATERTFFLHHGSNEFVLRGSHVNLPFTQIAPLQRNLNVTIANFRHPDLLDVRLNGRSAYPV